MLMLLLNYYSAKKRGGKRDLVWPISPINFKVVFTLLAKITAVKIGISII